MGLKLNRKDFTNTIKTMRTDPSCKTSYKQGRIKHTLKNIIVQLPYL